LPVAQSAPPEINVVPRPASLKMSTGTFLLTSDTRIVASDAESRRIAELFNDYLLEQHGLHLRISATRPRGPNYISFSQSGGRDLPDEGYRLRIEPESIRVTGRPAGLFYGMQTLRIVAARPQSRSSSCGSLEITDHPRFGYRGLLLDVSRHFYTVEYSRSCSTSPRNTGINPLSLASHRRSGLAYRDQALSEADVTGELLNADDAPNVAYYTQDQVREIVAYARARFNHRDPGNRDARALGSRAGRVSGTRLRAGRERGRVLSEGGDVRVPRNVLSEVIELFPSRYIHIGVTRSRRKAGGRARKPRRSSSVRD